MTSDIPSLTLVRPKVAQYLKGRAYLDEYQCSCGNLTLANSTQVKRGHTRSCGCLQLTVRTKHGWNRKGRQTRTSKIWAGMLYRCRNDAPNSKYYKGKGISVCLRWERFEAFLADMGECPPGMTLDRVDSTGDYEPGNCRWATKRQQAQNRSSNLVLQFRGESKCATEWAREMGILPITLLSRLRKGWSVEKALTAPVKKRIKENT